MMEGAAARRKTRKYYKAILGDSVSARGEANVKENDCSNESDGAYKIGMFPLSVNVGSINSFDGRLQGKAD